MASAVVELAARALVAQVRVETVVGGVDLDDPFAPAPPSLLLGLLKPKFTIVPVEGEPIVVAPWGDPGEPLGPLFVAGAVVVLALLLLRR